MLTELSSQLNTALPPLGEVTHKAIRAVESLFSAGCSRPQLSLGNSAILPANKEAASLSNSIPFYGWQRGYGSLKIEILSPAYLGILWQMSS